ncbi:glycoside hydrolase family 55 protein, partial [bacterium]|nr:glycoside hydrolase family 55 protein [bacterium]
MTDAPVNVRAFGAKGTGSGNDSAAISAALLSGARKILVPEGTYPLSSAISVTLPNDVELYGPGR